MARQRLIDNHERGTLRRRVIFIAAGIVGVFVTLVLVAATIWPVINTVETGRTAEYPEVLPRYYSADPSRVFNEALASVETLEDFTVSSSDPSTRTVEGVVSGPVFGFEHDVTVSVEIVTEFVTRVRMRSTSRVGKGDLGQNARNIETFFGEMDRRLGAVRFDPAEQEKKNKATEAKPATDSKPDEAPDEGEKPAPEE